MSEEKLLPELEQVKIKQTSPIRFRDEAINKILRKNINLKKKFLFQSSSNLFL